MEIKTNPISNKIKESKEIVNVETDKKVKNSKGKLISTLFRDILINLRSTKKEKIDKNEDEYVKLANQQITWVRAFLNIDNNPDTEKRIKLRKDIYNEIQNHFLKSDQYSKEYGSVAQLQAGIEAAYEVAKNLLENLKENEGLYFNSRLDAYQAIDYVKIIWDEDLTEIKEIDLIQVKSKNLDNKEKEKVLDKHQKYIERAKNNFESESEERMRFILENKEYKKTDELIDILLELATVNIKDLKESKNVNILHKLAIDIINGHHNNKLERLEEISKEYNLGVIELIKEMNPDGEDMILKNLETAYNNLKENKQVEKVEDYEYIENNMLSAKIYRSKLMYLDQNKKVIVEDLI